MLHRVSGKKLGRTSNQRKALFKGLARSVFTYGAIETTEAKAKAVLADIEKMANTAIKGDLPARRRLFSVFQDRNFVNSMVAKMQEVFGTQTSNFTFIKKVKRRQGDDALIVRLGLIKPFSLATVTVAKESSKEETKKVVKKEVKKVKKAETKKE